MPPTNLPISIFLLLNSTQINSRTSKFAPNNNPIKGFTIFLKKEKTHITKFTRLLQQLRKDWNLMMGYQKRTQKQVMLR